MAARPAHLLHEHRRARGGQPVQRRGVRRVVPVAHVLAHLDRGHGVEAGLGHLPVVLQPHVDQLAHALLGGAGLHERLLLAADRHRRHPGPVLPGGVQGERPPAAADVGQPLIGAGVQPELAADQLQLVRLRLLQGVGLVLPAAEQVRTVGGDVGARVGHLRVEDELVEVVGQVVVVADRGAVAGQAVQASPDDRLGGRGRRRSPEEAEVLGEQPHAGDRPGPLGRGRSWGTTHELVPDLRQRRPELALHDDLAGDEGLGGAELAGRPEEASQGLRAGEPHGRVGPRVGARRGAVPGDEVDRQRPAGQRCDQVVEAGGDRCRHTLDLITPCSRRAAGRLGLRHERGGRR